MYNFRMCPVFFAQTLSFLIRRRLHSLAIYLWSRCYGNRKDWEPQSTSRRSALMKRNSLLQPKTKEVQKCSKTLQRADFGTDQNPTSWVFAMTSTQAFENNLGILRELCETCVLTNFLENQMKFDGFAYPRLVSSKDILIFCKCF